MAELIDPELLTPMALELMKARDDILTCANRMNDPSKAGMALCYATAKFIRELAGASDDDVERNIKFITKFIANCVRDRHITDPVKWQ